MPGARRDRGGIGASGGASTPTDHRSDTARKRFVDLLRTNKMNMGIHTTSGQNHAFARNDLSRCTNWNRDRRLNIRVACLADTPDPTRLETDIGFNNPEHRIDDQCIGDDRVSHLSSHALTLPHAIADNLATPELDLFAVDRVVVFDLDDEIGVR